MTALSLTQGLTIPDEQSVHGSTWISVSLAFTVVSYQLSLPSRTAIPAAVWLAGASLLGTVLHRPGAWLGALPVVTWLLVDTALAQVVTRVVFRESGVADDAADRAARARQQWEVSEARRAAEREHLAALHDTACATLLIASAPWGSMRPETLRAQAARDLARLGAGQAAAGEVDLAGQLREEIAAHTLLRVTARLDDDLGTVWYPAAAALRGSLGEALRNAARVRRRGHRARDGRTPPARDRRDHRRPRRRLRPPAHPRPAHRDTALHMRPDGGRPWPGHRGIRPWARHHRTAGVAACLTTSTAT
jgi:hypothetical protein